ncbi:nuclear transport factor 2 family protein [Marinobacterium weihaiense]|uniref:Nuclear transport factor 2 family protein n=1 Tax=Marinobacterium weihaiense TaxID=2851016 RepID=A0ABS6MEQ1_9GAMM|nr:nuclear transport factor 2 family protein [Marinobacterium weihaiense]MBV0934705.1 nuclear transport factor 2 family protein [Marinobacterium weihaiense]
MINAQQVRDIMTRYIALVDANDVDAILALYADNAVVEDPVGQPPHVGIDAIAAFYRDGMGQMQVRARLEGPVRATDNGWGAMPFRVEVLGDEPCHIEVIDVMEFDADGRIRSMKAYWGALNYIPGEGT